MAPQVRFMAQRAASYGTAVLHKSLTMKHCSAKAPQYEASPFHSDKKHFAYAPYDVIKRKMRVYPFAIQRYPHYIMTCNPVLTDRFLYPVLPTESQAFTAISSPRQRTNSVIEPKEEVTQQINSQATVRRLLPVECERLMGFPDNHTRIVWKGKPEEDCPDAPRYKACGNSMAVNCMMWLGERIQAEDENIQKGNLNE